MKDKIISYIKKIANDQIVAWHIFILEDRVDVFYSKFEEYWKTKNKSEERFDNIHDILYNSDIEKEIIPVIHKIFIDKTWRTYTWSFLSKKKNIRETHCYKCKRNIDNKNLFECSSCGWIICKCWSCGCWFS
jgi:hypothetical protein